MATVTNKFHATLKRPEPFKARVATLLVQSNEVYKGEFAILAELQKISAYSGDYADVYETNTRWVFMNGVWTNSEKPIPVNPILATKQDVSDLNVRVASLEAAIGEITTRLAQLTEV